MEFLRELADVVLHLDAHLNQWAESLGPWTYVLLFAIVFAETGLVVTPFLPGDSLLFAVGALAASEGSPIEPVEVAVLLCVAAVLGDAVNYAVGKALGPKVFTSEGSRLLNKKHLVRTQRFYEKHGGKTIILARFVPIVRTFAPFVAGIGRMGYRRFAMFNVVGGAAWVLSMTFTGYFLSKVVNKVFGEGVLEKRIELVIGAVVFLSILPGIISWWRARGKAKEKPAEATPTP